MKILWLSWKDLNHPLAGGAEVVNEEFATRLVKDGHKVTFLVGGFKTGDKTSKRNGFTIIRLGNRFTVYWKAYRYYRQNLKDWPDLVIDEVNTIPFFAKFYTAQRNVLFVHMLCRQIWFYQLPQPLSTIGYLLEPLYLRLLRDREVITVSDSTKKDLLRHGFHEANVHIISEGIDLISVRDLYKIQKYPQPTLLILGSLRPMKRPDHAIRAFELAKAKMPELELRIAGESDSRYGQKTVRELQASRYANDIKYLGRVTTAQKIELLQRSHLLLVTSVKEGWGLVVTEAASQGTPSVVYDVDGLRDSVFQGEAGVIAATNTPESLAKLSGNLLRDDVRYTSLRETAWRKSKEISFGKGYIQFKEAAGLR